MMASQTNNHPLPPPPGNPQRFPSLDQQQFRQYQQQQPPPPHQQHQQQQQQYGRPSAQEKRPRTFSFRSDKSQKSSTSQPSQRADLTETHAEKEAKRLHSKADPTLAMNEAEPSAVAAGVKSSLASLRDFSHRDPHGNVISDPDRSNPTRSRWERPLDTIRSFEAAIDGGYSRKSMIRSDTESIANWNRRSSYYGNGPARFPQDSYYGGRPNSFMPSQSQLDLRQGTPGGYFDQQPPQGGNPMNGRQRYPRMASEPQFNTVYRQAEQNIYPMPNNHRSYETVASGSGSGTSGEPAGYQTDPTSSDNSSIERVQPPPKPKPEPVNDYGIGFSQTPTYQPQAFSLGGANRASPRGMPQPQPQNGYNGPPVPRKDNGNNNVIMRKPTRQPSMEQAQQERPAMGEKRKSWFARRFSKQG